MKGGRIYEEVHSVELVYAGQNVDVTETATSFYNERQRVEIDLIKSLAIDEAYGMHNSQNYSLINAHNSEVLRIMHKGIAGGWAVEDICGFVPEIICGIFIFCRYIEQENEFLIV